jgi:hypothetical protein
VVLRPRVPVPAECLFVETDDPSAGAITPEIYPRPDGEVYVCGMADDLTGPGRARRRSASPGRPRRPG